MQADDKAIAEAYLKSQIEELTQTIRGSFFRPRGDTCKSPGKQHDPPFGGY